MLLSKYKTSIIEQSISPSEPPYVELLCFEFELKSLLCETFKHKEMCSNLQHPHSKHFQFLLLKQLKVRWPSMKPNNLSNLNVVGNQGHALGSSVIGRLECSSGQVSNPIPEYWVSVMPGLHWTHVWNRRCEDTVTYLNSQEEHVAHSVCVCWGVRGWGHTKCHQIHLTQIWCLVKFYKAKLHEFWLR